MHEEEVTRKKNQQEITWERIKAAEGDQA